MNNTQDILQSEFFKDLIKNPKPTFLPYFKSEGPIITAENQAVVVETLMLDYLKKKAEILNIFKDYVNKKSDIEILESFENDVAASYGKQINVMHFYMYNPAEDLLTQLEKVMSEENFQKWAIV